MAHTSIHDLTENLAKAKLDLKNAKASGKKGSDLKPYDKAVKNAEIILRKAKDALK
jgi:hypothetical protein